MATYQELLKQQAALSVQIEEARKREIADAVNRARQIVAEYGLTEKDVFPAGRRSPVTRATSKVAPKYRDPATGQTWTGRGKPPKWIEGRDRLGFWIACSRRLFARKAPFAAPFSWLTGRSRSCDSPAAPRARR